MDVLMKTWIWTIIFFIALGVVGYLFSKTPTGERIMRIPGQVQSAWLIINKLEDFATHTSIDVDLLLARQMLSDKKIDSLMTANVGHVRAVADLRQQIASLPDHEIPELSEVEPEDYEECLQELQRSRQAAEELVVIVEGQREHIRLLEAVNRENKLINESQHQVITLQAADNQKWRDAIDEIRKDANRTKFIGYVVGALGILVAVL